jgi:zinc protease
MHKETRMRRTLSWFALVLVLFLAASAQAAAKAKPAAKPAAPAAAVADDSARTTFVRLENGLGVLVREDDRFPLTNIRILVHAGSAYERPEQAGISHMLEHMVFKGAGDPGPDMMGPGEAARRIETAGGSLNAATSFDHTVYHVEVPDKAWRLGLQVVSDMTFKPAIIPAELTSEKEVVLAELKRGEDTPDSMLFQAAQSLVWAGTSYERPIIGYRETVRPITAESMRAYIAPLYQPQNMLLCVVGRVKAADVVAEAERLLGKIPNTAKIAPPTPFPPQKAAGPQVKVVPGMWKKVHLALAFPAPDFLSAKMPGLDMLAQILGGDETSRLYRTLKYEKRLVDSVSVGSSNLERSGMLVVSAVLDADKLPAALDAIAGELAAFDPASITDQELARARTNIEAGLFLSRETLEGLAGKITMQYAFEGGPQGEANYLSAIAAMTRPQLADLYREFFRPEQLSLVVLSPAGAKLDGAALLARIGKRWPARAVAEKAAAAGRSEVRQIALPGGATLVLLPDATLPYVAVSMSWPGGDGLLKPEEQGLGTLTASLLTRGTQKRSATQLEDFLADRAAGLGANSGTETFNVNAKFPSRFAGDMFGLLREILESPAFAADELARAKEDQLSAIARSEDQPIGLLFRNLPQTVFASAPHDLLRLGLPEQVKGFTREQAADLWARQSRRPFVLSVCGQYDEAQITAFAQALARELVPAGGPAGAAFAAPQWQPRAARELSLKGRNQAHLLVVFKTPGRADQETTARLSVLRAALAGQSGLLFRDMRDKQGLGYTVTAFLSQYNKAGLFAFYIGTDPDKLPQALAGFKKAASGIAAAPLPEDELARAKNVLAGEYYQDRQGLAARSREAAAALVQGLPRDAELALVERERALTAEEVRQAAAGVIKWDEAYVLEVRP